MKRISDIEDQYIHVGMKVRDNAGNVSEIIAFGNELCNSIRVPEKIVVLQYEAGISVQYKKHMQAFTFAE